MTIKKILAIPLCVLLATSSLTGCTSELHRGIDMVSELVEGLSVEETPEGVLRALYSGKMGSVQNIIYHLYFPYNAENFDYRALGYDSFEDYRLKLINYYHNIDYAESLNLEKIGKGDDSHLYKITGVIHMKNGESSLLNKYVCVDIDKSQKDSQKCVVHGEPYLYEFTAKDYIYSIDNTKIMETKIITYWIDEYTAVSIRFRNLTDEQYVLSNWPHGASVTWRGSTVTVNMPIVISPKNTPLYTFPDGSKYNGSIFVSFPQTKSSSSQEANDNESIKIQFLQLGHNNMPDLNATKHILNYKL